MVYSVIVSSTVYHVRQASAPVLLLTTTPELTETLMYSLHVSTLPLPLRPLLHISWSQQGQQEGGGGRRDERDTGNQAGGEQCVGEKGSTQPQPRAEPR